MIAVIQYNAGNTRSVLNALGRLGIEAQASSDPEFIECADKVIFPGVGEAGTAMEFLKRTSLDTMLKTLTQPVLGICLGMQLMCAKSEEGNTPCLGIFDETVKRFAGEQKVPHMGWNSLQDLRGPLFKYNNQGDDMYFVHSYYAAIGANSIAHCNYDIAFSAAMHRDNFYGVQFHPEKSGKSGALILKAFTEIRK